MKMYSELYCFHLNSRSSNCHYTYNNIKCIVSHFSVIPLGKILLCCIIVLSKFVTYFFFGFLILFSVFILCRYIESVEHQTGSFNIQPSPTPTNSNHMHNTQYIQYIVLYVLRIRRRHFVRLL